MRMLPKPALRAPSPGLLPVIRDLAAALDPTSLLERAGYDAPEPWQQDLLLSCAKRIAVLCPRQVGKSTTTAAMALHHALYRPGFIVVIVSPSERQSNLLFDKVIDILDNLPDKPSGSRRVGGRLELPNGSQLISLPGKEQTIRGLSADLIIIDEAAQVSEKLFGAVVPMVAASKGRIVILSTAFGKKGFFYRACTQPASGWSLVKITAEESQRLSPEALEEARHTLDLHWYRQEFLCEFLGDSTQYFDPELIAAAFDPTVEPFYERGPATPSERTTRRAGSRRPVQRRSRNQEPPRFVVAVDIGISRAFTALVLLERVERQGAVEYHLKSLKRFPLRTQSPEIITYISDLLARRTLVGRTGLIVDASGIGTPIVQEMARCGLRPRSIIITSGVRTKGNSVPKRTLVSRLLLLLEQGRLKFPPDLKLRAELVGEFDSFSVNYTANGNPTFSASAGAHDDLILALTLGCHFFESYQGLPRVRATVVGTTQRTPVQFDVGRMVENRMLRI